MGALASGGVKLLPGASGSPAQGVDVMRQLPPDLQSRLRAAWSAVS